MASVAASSMATSPSTGKAPLMRSLPAVRRAMGLSRGRKALVPCASSAPKDIDALVALATDSFEKADNKPVVVGYTAAAAGAFVFSEWLMHLPLFNVLLGFPVQLLGLLTAGYLGTRWVVDKVDYWQDLTKVTKDVTDKLPGL